MKNFKSSFFLLILICCCSTQTFAQSSNLNLVDEYLVGDWDGSGKDNIAIRVGDRIYKDFDLDGIYNKMQAYGLGTSEDEYLMGDWDGTGKAKPAVRRGNQILMDTDFNNVHNLEQRYGRVSDVDEYLVGDWDGDGRDNIAVRIGNKVLMDTDFNTTHNLEQSFGRGNAEDEYLVGDWDGDGKDNLAVRRGNQILMDTDFNHTHDLEQRYGRVSAVDEYLVGDWDGDGRDNIAVRIGNKVLMDTDFNKTHNLEVVFDIPFFVDPRDNQIYTTVTINGITWMAENLKYHKFPNTLWPFTPPVGTPVNYPASAYPNNIAYNTNKYGRLYTWEQAKVACPPGWRFPRWRDWETLPLIDGKIIWSDPFQTIPKNKKNYRDLIEGGVSGFNAVLGGMYINHHHKQGYYDLGYEAYYWTSYWSKYVTFKHDEGAAIKEQRIDMNQKYSCRCIQGYYSSTTTLKTHNGHYLSAENGGGGALNANRSKIGEWETFTVIDLGFDKVALKTHNGHYLSAENGGGGALNANSTKIGEWETFTKEDLTPDIPTVDQLSFPSITLKTHNGHYLVAEGGGGSALNANRRQVGEFEIFRLGWEGWQLKN